MSTLLLLLACRPDPSATHEPTSPAPTETGTESTPTGTTGFTPPTGVELVGAGAVQFVGRVPKNLLMISVDTFRKDHLPRYGAAADATPKLAELMEEGVVFDDHRQCSNWTFPTTSCTLMGQYHESNGFIPQISLEGRGPFPPETVFLAERLRDAGFDTSVGSNNSWLSNDYDALQGYDTVLPRVPTALQQLLQGVDHVSTVASGTPWFFHAHVTEPHVPYDPPESYLGELEGLAPIAWDLTVSEVHYAARDDWPEMTPAEQELVLQHMQVRYRADIRWLDDQIRDGLQAFDDAGLLDDTLVVVWNDHGEQFWEHGHLTHAYDMHGEENDGFLFFWSKNVVPRAWGEPTSALDMVPTLLALYGLPTDERVEGEVLGTADPQRPHYMIAAARLGGISAVRRGDDFLIFYWKTGVRERYDLALDPDETLDRFDPQGAVDQQLWSMLVPRIADASAAAPLVPLEWPEPR